MFVQMDSQLCGRCGKLKSANDFHRRGLGGRQAWCKECRRVYDAAYHRRTWGEARRAQKRERQHEFSAWYRCLKDGPCTDCGGHFDPVVMQWDHLPGHQKSANLSDLAGTGSRRRVLEELEKCELVCANCHALRTVRRLGA
jgi:hypothetical protein